MFLNIFLEKIQATYEITDIQARENAKLQFRSADGHFININEANDVICAKRAPDDSCTFTVRFPNYQWNEEGGVYDKGSFYLQAHNGEYCRYQSKAGIIRLYADAERENAQLFNATFTNGNVVSIATDNGLQLQHTPPYAELELVETNIADATWAWFNANYV